MNVNEWSERRARARRSRATSGARARGRGLDAVLGLLAAAGLLLAGLLGSLRSGRMAGYEPEAEVEVVQGTWAGEQDDVEGADLGFAQQVGSDERWFTVTQGVVMVGVDTVLSMCGADETAVRRWAGRIEAALPETETLAASSSLRSDLGRLYDATTGLVTEVLLRSSLREALSTLEVHSSRTLDATLSEDTFVDFHKQVLEVMAGENTAESTGVESLRPSLESLLARLSTEGAVSLPLLQSMMQRLSAIVAVGAGFRGDSAPTELVRQPVMRVIGTLVLRAGMIIFLTEAIGLDTRLAASAAEHTAHALLHSAGRTSPHSEGRDMHERFNWNSSMLMRVGVELGTAVLLRASLRSHLAKMLSFSSVDVASCVDSAVNSKGFRHLHSTLLEHIDKKLDVDALTLQAVLDSLLANISTGLKSQNGSPFLAENSASILRPAIEFASVLTSQPPRGAPADGAKIIILMLHGGLLLLLEQWGMETSRLSPWLTALLQSRCATAAVFSSQQSGWMPLLSVCTSQLLRMIISKAVSVSIQRLTTSAAESLDMSYLLSLLNFDQLDRWVAKKLVGDNHEATNLQLCRALDALGHSVTETIGALSSSDTLADEVIAEMCQEAAVAISTLDSEISGVVNAVAELRTTPRAALFFAVAILLTSTVGTDHKVAQGIAELSLRDVQDLMNAMSSAAGGGLDSIFQLVRQRLPQLKSLLSKLRDHANDWLVKKCKLPRLVASSLVDYVSSGEAFAPLLNASGEGATPVTCLASLFEGTLRRIFGISSANATGVFPQQSSALLIELAIALLQHSALMEGLKRQQQNKEAHVDLEHLQAQVETLMSALATQAAANHKEAEDWSRMSAVDNALKGTTVDSNSRLVRRLVGLPVEILKLSAHDTEAGRIAKMYLGMDDVTVRGQFLRGFMWLLRAFGQLQNGLTNLYDSFTPGSEWDPLVVRLPSAAVDQLIGESSSDHENLSQLHRCISRELSKIAEGCCSSQGVNELGFLASVYTALRRVAFKADGNTGEVNIHHLEAQANLMKSRAFREFLERAAEGDCAVARRLLDILNKGRLTLRSHLSQHWATLQSRVKVDGRKVRVDSNGQSGVAVVQEATGLPFSLHDYHLVKADDTHADDDLQNRLIMQRRLFLADCVRTCKTETQLFGRQPETVVKEAVDEIGQYWSLGSDSSDCQWTVPNSPKFKIFETFKCHECKMPVASEGQTSNCTETCTTQCPGGAAGKDFSVGQDPEVNKAFFTLDEDAIGVPVVLQLISAFARGSGAAQQFASDVLGVSTGCIACRLAVSLSSMGVTRSQSALVVRALQARKVPGNDFHQRDFAVLISVDVNTHHGTTQNLHRDRARAMHSLLISTFGFGEQNIRSLAGTHGLESTLRETTVELIDWLNRCASSRVGARIVFFFSGSSWVDIAHDAVLKNAFSSMPSDTKVFLLMDCVHSGLELGLQSSFDTATGQMTVSGSGSESGPVVQMISASHNVSNEGAQQAPPAGNIGGITAAFQAVVQERQSAGRPAIPASVVELTQEMAHALACRSCELSLRPRVSTSTCLSRSTKVYALQGLVDDAQGFTGVTTQLEQAIERAAWKLQGQSGKIGLSSETIPGTEVVGGRAQLLAVVSSQNLLRAAHLRCLRAALRVPDVLYSGLDFVLLEKLVLEHTLLANRKVLPTELQTVVAAVFPAIYSEQLQQDFVDTFGMCRNESKELVSAMALSDATRVNGELVRDRLRHIMQDGRDTPALVSRALLAVNLCESFAIDPSYAKLLVDAMLISASLQACEMTVESERRLMCKLCCINIRGKIQHKENEKTFKQNQRVKLTPAALQRFQKACSRRFQSEVGVVVDSLHKKSLTSTQILYRVRFPYCEVREFLRLRGLSFLYHQLDSAVHLLSVRHLRNLRETDLKHITSDRFSTAEIIQAIQRDDWTLNVDPMESTPTVAEPSELPVVQGYALLIGIGSGEQNSTQYVNPCQDARAMQCMLIADFGFAETNVRMLVNDDSSAQLPTQKNILQSIAWLQKCASNTTGAKVLVQFCGRSVIRSSIKAANQNCLVACKDDLHSTGECDNLIDDSMLKNAFSSMPSDTKVFLLMDCVYSGLGLGLQSSFDAATGQMTVSGSGSESGPVVQMISGSQSRDSGNTDVPCSITSAFQTVVEERRAAGNPLLPASIVELVLAMDQTLSDVAGMSAQGEFSNGVAAVHLQASTSEGCFLQAGKPSPLFVLQELLDVVDPGQAATGNRFKEFWYNDEDLIPDTFADSAVDPDLRKPLSVENISTYLHALHNNVFLYSDPESRHLDRVVEKLNRRVSPGGHPSWMKHWNFRDTWPERVGEMDVHPQALCDAVTQALRRFMSLQLMDSYGLCAEDAVYLSRSTKLWEGVNRAPLLIRVSRHLAHCDGRTRWLVCLCIYTQLKKETTQLAHQSRATRLIAQLVEILTRPLCQVAVKCCYGRHGRDSSEVDVLDPEHLSYTDQDTADVNACTRVRELHRNSDVRSVLPSFDDNQPSDSIRSMMFLLVQVWSFVIMIPTILKLLSSCTVGIIDGNGFNNCTWDIENATAVQGGCSDSSLEEVNEDQHGMMVSQVVIGGVLDTFGLLAGLFNREALSVGVSHGKSFRQFVLLGLLCRSGCFSNGGAVPEHSCVG